jgi:C1A family cysteine protease
MKSPRDQGQQGSCSAQTVAAVKEWQEYVDMKYKEYMSPQFVYDNRQNQNSEGMMPRDTMKILQKIGIVPEKDYPYGTNKEITEDLKEKASKYKIKAYARVNNVDSLMKALYLNGPCYIAFPVFNPNNMEFWKQEFPSQPMLGGHAVCVVGYIKNAFIIRNSWSIQWGDKGYTYYPFNDFIHHWEIWTILDRVLF